MQLTQSNILASLDIGSSKIVCLIGYTNLEGKLYIKGVAHQESKGIKDGEVVDSKLLTKSIISAIAFAEKMAGLNIEDIIINISGSAIRSNLITLEKQFNNRIITKNNLIEISSKIEDLAKEQKKEIIHLIPTQFYIDNVEVSNPFDLNIDDFRVCFNVIMTEKLKIENLKNCLKRTPLNIAKFIYTPYASALGCITQMEKEAGTLVIDIGAGSSSFAVINKNIFIYGGTIKIGGNNITEDIANKLNIKFEIAEKIKVKNTDLSLTARDEEELIKMEIDSDEEFSAAQHKIKLINNIFKKYIENIILIIFENLKKKKNVVENIHLIVLTGGSCVNNVDMFISDLVGINTRIGVPDFNLLSNSNIEPKQLKNPMYSCAIGLLHYLKNTRITKQIDDYQNYKNRTINKFFDSLIKLFIT